jgi:hypothetical protein
MEKGVGKWMPEELMRMAERSTKKGPGAGGQGSD